VRRVTDWATRPWRRDGGPGARGASAAEAGTAVVSAAALYVAGAALTATTPLLPRVGSPAGVAAIAVTALVTATGLLLAARRSRASIALACAADLWGVLLVALLCAATGGAHSPFALIYFFAIGHAAAFQPRAGVALVIGASLVAFLAPLAYSDVPAVFGAIACVGAVLALLGGGVVHLALSRARDQHRLLESLITTLRRSLMPAQLPQVPGIDLASFFRPLGAGDEVGGDFFDVLVEGEGCWLVVGDVCGKGAEAAALTGFVRHTAMAYARETDSPAAVLRHVNQTMLERDFGGRFATALLAHLRRIEPADGGEQRVEARVATAGHPPALLARFGGLAIELGRYGTLLGVYQDPQIAETSAMLGAGDALALYTDGLVEAQAPRRAVSVEEMLGALAGIHPAGSQEVLDELLRLVDVEQGARDDIAILVAQVRVRALDERLRPPERERPGARQPVRPPSLGV
jgi:serine phosphatase RsbU (regulator of sigma subunit)